MNQRHHGAHPPTSVRPNEAVNKHPETYTPPPSATETHAQQMTPVNPNPSLGPVGINVDSVSPSVKAVTRETDNQDVDADEDDDALLVS